MASPPEFSLLLSFLFLSSCFYGKPVVLAIRPYPLIPPYSCPFTDQIRGRCSPPPRMPKHFSSLPSPFPFLAPLPAPFLELSIAKPPSMEPTPPPESSDMAIPEESPSEPLPVFLTPSEPPSISPSTILDEAPLSSELSVDFPMPPQLALLAPIEEAQLTPSGSPEMASLEGPAAAPVLLDFPLADDESPFSLPLEPQPNLPTPLPSQAQSPEFSELLVDFPMPPLLGEPQMPSLAPLSEAAEPPVFSELPVDLPDQPPFPSPLDGVTNN